MRVAVITITSLVLASGATSTPIPQSPTIDNSSGQSVMVFSDGSRLSLNGKHGSQVLPPLTAPPSVASTPSNPVGLVPPASTATPYQVQQQQQQQQVTTPRNNKAIIGGTLGAAGIMLTTGGFLLCQKAKFFCKPKVNAVEKAAEESLEPLLQSTRNNRSLDEEKIRAPGKH